MSSGNQGHNVAIGRLLAKVRRDLRSVVVVSESCRELSATVKLLRVADRALLAARQAMSISSSQLNHKPAAIPLGAKPCMLSQEQVELLDDALREWQKLAAHWSALDIESASEESPYGPPDGPAPGRTKHSFWAHVRRCCGDDLDDEDSRLIEERQVDQRLSKGGMGAVYNDLDAIACRDNFAWEVDYVAQLESLATSLLDATDKNAQEVGSRLIADAVGALGSAKCGRVDTRNWALSDS